MGDPVPPASGVDPNLWSLFVGVDVDRSGRISAQELQRALTNEDRTHFDLDTVKLLMSLFDVNKSGILISTSSLVFGDTSRYVPGLAARARMM
ncbi:hypothetical protein BJV78DRAFT_1191145, partial [Lactifluus subvellereus]